MHDLKIRSIVQDKVHASNGVGGEILFLSKELAPEPAVVAVMLLDVADGSQQHATRAAGGIVDGFSFLRIEDIHHQPHHRTRSIELACLLVGGIGKLLDQVFVGLPECVVLSRLIAKVDAREVLNEVTEQRVGEPFFVRPLRIAF